MSRAGALPTRWKGISVVRPHKYGAKPTEVDGLRFDSKREAARYSALQLLVRAGEIVDLEVQPTYPIIIADPQGMPVIVAAYRADFRYRRGRDVVVEDVKGVRTPLYRLKKKLVEALYGIKITEV